MIIKVIITTLLSVFLTIFMFHNDHAVCVDLWPLSLHYTLPLSLLVFMTFLTGALMGGGFVWFHQLIKRIRLRYQKKQI